MFFIISKILYFLIQPLVWVLLFLIIGLLSKSPTKKKRWLFISLLSAFLFSNEFFYNQVGNRWENSIPSNVSSSDTFEVAIVLGGISHYDEEHQLHNFNSSSDRLLALLPLYYEGRIKKILLSGGSGSLTNSEEKEADVLGNYLRSIGIPDSVLLIENRSRNTYENAKYSLELIKEQQLRGNVLLSTSAMHMSRSYACFKKLGSEPYTLPVNFVSNGDFSPDQLFIPQPDIMNKWYWLLHEWLGIISYRFMGYC